MAKKMVKTKRGSRFSYTLLRDSSTVVALQQPILQTDLYRPANDPQIGPQMIPGRLTINGLKFGQWI